MTDSTALLSKIVFLCVFFAFITIVGLSQNQPFEGTIFIDSDIIVPSDQLTFQNLSYAGIGSRTMFDRRVNDWINVDAHLIEASFDDGLSAEIQVNPEFDSTAAMNEAEKYIRAISQLPTVFRSKMETVWIHKGVQAFGGGNNNILIHTGQGELYINDGILEETLVHEAAHTSLDPDHANSEGWLAARAADPDFISTYAADNRDREDIAESFLPYIAIRYRSDRISQDLADVIVETMPNRIAYFDEQNFDMYPISTTTTSVEDNVSLEPNKSVNLFQNSPNPLRNYTKISYSIPKRSYVTLKIINSFGQQIQTLVNGYQSADLHSYRWHTRGLSGGIYFYQLTVNNESATTSKMILIR